MTAAISAAVTVTSQVIIYGLKRLFAGEIDDDLTGFAGNVADINAFAVAVFELCQQRQWIVVVAEMHGFARMQGVKRAKNSSMAEAFGDATGIERVTHVGRGGVSAIVNHFVFLKRVG